MESLKPLNVELKKYLKQSSVQIIEHLALLLKGENLDYFDGKNKKDIKSLYFEYEYDYLDIMVWAVDEKGEIITHTVTLTSQKKEKSAGNSNWNSFLPEKIWMTASGFQYHHEEDDDFHDLWDEYNDEKYELFENWFFDCWKKASAQTESRADAYFSIHDTYFRTDLNTFKTISDDDIATRYTSG
ncbi:hypothetical protein [Chryseobacterium luteum]|uniref:Uncharacterized protein n=1 Tax=Chryseobacterium luteum TaxID=421531 RepID=A0A085ZU56_9FLAO|nr:hypothetical protein [Chryseobacterium luteum]KFF07970.1 hypothetical protein IX38_07335 [Chryseobacterium luteum]